MSLLEELVDAPTTELKVGNLLAQGSRVQVYSVGESNVLRVPFKEDNDIVEVLNLDLLQQYFAEFLPNPRVLRTVFGEAVRSLIFCTKIKSRFLSHVPTAHAFQTHLDTDLSTIQEKIIFLRRLRKFVDQCKKFFYESLHLPDLVGKGNCVAANANVHLLDFNNSVFDLVIPNDGSVVVPLDDKGYPIFDLSL